MEGVVFDIQRFSLHDGPGIRTTVFLAGCNLRCKWCHNPRKLAYHPAGAAALSHEMHRLREMYGGLSQPLPHQRKRDASHPAGGLYRLRPVRGRMRCRCAGDMSNQHRNTEDIIKTVLLDRPFYKETGGMTVSGGEPMLQSEFALDLLRLAKQEGILPLSIRREPSLGNDTSRLCHTAICFYLI